MTHCPMNAIDLPAFHSINKLKPPNKLKSWQNRGKSFLSNSLLSRFDRKACLMSGGKKTAYFTITQFTQNSQNKA